jgi:hypothetical protein
MLSPHLAVQGADMTMNGSKGYEDFIREGRVTLPDEIEEIHKQVLEFERISRPLRELIEELWPELAPKLPPKQA